MQLKQVITGIAISLLIGLPSPAKAQSDACDRAIAESQHQIETKNTFLTRIEKRNMSSSGVTYLPDYPIMVAIAMVGPGTESVMKSDAFLTKLSHDIIMSCGPVGVVRFGQDGTDWSVTFGLVGDRKVALFKCLSRLNNWRESERVIPWGYEICY